ncbi:Rrf2 family transcriptional regulator [candidate division KSB1 bacterium]|nr:Rrf2 family transcriptional regulator [candidate division KSB1 bacterium]
MVLSKACDYGIRAILYIAVNTERQFVPINEIAKELNISFHFLTKILQVLTQKGILASFKGPKGGVRLARPGNDILLYDIVVAIDGDDLFTQCVLGLEGCGEGKPCPLHDEWGPIRDNLKTVFQQRTIADLAKQITHMNYRLTDLIKSESV